MEILTLLLKLVVLVIAGMTLVVFLIFLNAKLRLKPRASGIISILAGISTAIPGVIIGVLPLLSSEYPLENIILGGFIGTIGFLIFFFSLKATLSIQDKENHKT